MRRGRRRGEDDDHQEHEEEHAVDGVAGAPFEAEIFAEMLEDGRYLNG